MTAKKLPEPSVKVMLAFPEKVSGVEVDHLVMRRPKVRDNIAASKASKDQTEQAAHLVASLCEITLDDLSDFDQANWSVLEAQYMAFTQGKP